MTACRVLAARVRTDAGTDVVTRQLHSAGVDVYQTGAKARP